MPSLAALAVVRATAMIPYGDDTVKVGYNSEIITTAWLEKLEAFQHQAQHNEMSEDEARDGIAGFVCELLTDWDVTEDTDGQIPAALSVANVRKTSLEFQGALLRGVVGHYTAKNRPGMTRAKSRKRLRHTS